MTTTTLTVPDLGDIAQAEIIELLVKVGDVLTKDQVLMTLESDKALLEVPASHAGTITEILVKAGQAVKSGDALMMITSEEAAVPVKAEPVKAAQPVKTDAPKPAIEKAVEEKPVEEKVVEEKVVEEKTPAVSAAEAVITVPDLGDIASADVVDILVKVGDDITLEQTVVTLESDKALLEVPASQAGRVQSIEVKPGQSLKSGDVILKIAIAGKIAVEKSAPVAPASKPEASKSETKIAEPVVQSAAPAVTSTTTTISAAAQASSEVYAGPAVRRLSNQLGVALTQVTATGPRGRVLKEDVHAYVKQRLQAPVQTGGAVSAELPTIDFSQWGKIEEVKLNGIQKKSAQNLTRAWQMIPHVTQFDLADITDLEAFRKSEAQAKNLKLTMLAFLVKASGYALQQFPKFKSSLQSDGSTLVMKNYCHIGIAVDTPNGLLVPVIRDVDQKSVLAIAQDIIALSDKAKKKQLTGNDMKGGCFTISSLGGIGGTGFTPIVNWPEVAILGVSRSSQQPVWQGNAFVPRLMLPLSLSYDHRVIDGADAARFTRYLADLLADIRRVLL
jgi:pyruvate dehydrogenase E2 component (dihydrolipoamide acetyltransferase)